MARLSGKTAVITGGSTGLGLETAKEFLAEGARIIITGTNEERLNAAASELGANAIAVQSDVRSLSDLDALAERVKTEFSSLDILFANAGIGYFKPLEQVDEAFYQNLFDVNVKGVFFTVQKLASLLSEGASVILNASAVHTKGVATGSLYFASKAAVRSFARSLAAELAPRQIRVNSISPGIVKTNFFEESKVDMSKEQVDGFFGFVTQVTPMARAGRPEEIAKAVVFLASDDSSYMTASDVLVDGGFMSV